MPDKFCFVISPIGESGSSERRRADGVLDEIIRAAIEGRGYRVERADHDKTPGVVTEAIINKIIDADLVVADLTGPNPNVMYELAVRHATGKPVIHIIEEGGKLPFDIQALNTIFFAPDLAGRQKAITDITAADKALSVAADVGNPIKRTVELRTLKGSGAQSTESVLVNTLLDIQSNVAQLRSEVWANARRDPEVAPVNPGPAVSVKIFTDPRLIQREIMVRSAEVGPSGVVAHGTVRGRPLRVEVTHPGWFRGRAEDVGQLAEQAILRFLAEAGPTPETGSADVGSAKT